VAWDRLGDDVKYPGFNIVEAGKAA
jgi:hypothetical protein